MREYQDSSQEENITTKALPRALLEKRSEPATGKQSGADLPSVVLYHKDAISAPVTINRKLTKSGHAVAQSPLLQMQRYFGNKYVQRMLSLARHSMVGVADDKANTSQPSTNYIGSGPVQRQCPYDMTNGSGVSRWVHQNKVNRSAVQQLVIQRDDNDDPHKPPPLVGQNRPVDPQDNFCSLTWTPGGQKWLLPNGVSCDPGMVGLPGQGDPFKYPGDKPETPSGPANGIDRPANCPPDRWEPPSPKNWYYGQCRAPGLSATPPPVTIDSGTTMPPSPVPQPVVTWGTPEMYPADQQPVDTSTQPGDYNVPSPDDEQQSA